MVRRLKLSDAIESLEKLYGRPRTAERPDEPLLDHLLVGILSKWTDRERAARATRALSESFLDLNEARVSPLAELVTVLEPYVGKDDALAAATAARNALQDVFDGTHGLDLEPLRGRDPDDLKKFLKDLPHTMGGPAAVVPQLALGDAHLSLSLAEQRVLSRLAVLPRASTPQRVRQALEKQVKPAERLRFAWAVGSHAGAVCFAKEPACEACPMLPHCPFGEQEVKLRVAERKRLEAKRLADEKKRKEAEEKAARIAARHAAAEAKKKAVADAKAKRVADAKAKKDAAKRQVVEARKAKADAAAKKRAEAEAARRSAAKAKAKKTAKR